MADAPLLHENRPDRAQTPLTRRLTQIDDALRIATTEERIAADSVNYTAVQQIRQRTCQLAAERDELLRRLDGTSR